MIKYFNLHSKYETALTFLISYLANLLEIKRKKRKSAYYCVWWQIFQCHYYQVILSRKTILPNLHTGGNIMLYTLYTKRSHRNYS